MIDIKKPHEYNFLEVMEDLDRIKEYAKNLESAKINGSIKALENGLKESRRGIRDILVIENILNERKSIELNEDEYLMTSEYLINHDTGFILEKVVTDLDYYKLKRLR